MKKFLSVLLTVILALSFSFSLLACGGNPTQSSKESSSSSSVEQSATKYVITFANEDGTVLQQSEVEEGEMPLYQGQTPQKAQTAQYTFTFKGWDKQISVATQNATYTAVFESAVRKYVVKFLNEDGSILEQMEVEYGQTPSYSGTPEKAEDDKYTYTFNGWDKEVVAVTGEAVYTATYTANQKVDPNDPYGSDIY